MSAAQIGIALKGRRNGHGWLVSCPCLNHGKGRGDLSPSLSVADGDDGRLLLRCFAGCEFVEILDELKRRGIVPSDGVDRPEPDRRPVQPSEHAPDPEALKVWVASSPARGTVVAQYLERRGIALQPPPSLRCRVEVPAMVAADQRPDGKVVSIQQLKLTNEGEKAAVTPPRITTGALGAGAVRFGPADEVLGLAEGVETALSAMQLTGVTVWASLGSRIHMLNCRPRSRKSTSSSTTTSQGGRPQNVRRTRHTSVGRQVYLRSPPDQCGDWNDFLNLIADRDGCDPLTPAKRRTRHDYYLNTG